MNNHEIETSIEVKSLPHEMYLSANYFERMYRNTSDYFEKDRAVVFNIISLATSFESLINKYLERYLKKASVLTPIENTVLSFLQKGGDLPKEISSIFKKLKMLSRLAGLDEKKLLTIEFKTFYEKVISIRNNIVHYSSSSFSSAYGCEAEYVLNNGKDLLLKAVKSIFGELNEKVPDYYLI